MSTFNRDSTFMSFWFMNSWIVPYDLLKWLHFSFEMATFLTLNRWVGIMGRLRAAIGILDKMTRTLFFKEIAY